MGFESYSTKPSEPTENIVSPDAPLPESPLSEVESPCISQENFEKQLQTPSEVVVNGVEGKQHQISYTEINPEVLKNDKPIVFVGGIATTAISYDSQLLALTQRGRRIIFINPGEGITTKGDLENYAQTHNLPETIQSKTNEVDILLQKLAIGQFDLVGHSQGGAIASLLTAYMPGRVGKLILDTPIGLTEMPSVIELARRGISEARNEHRLAAISKKAGDSSGMKAWMDKYLLPNLKLKPRYRDIPGKILRRRKEIKGISQTNIIPLLEDIQRSKQQPEGVVGPGPEVILLTAQSDSIIKAEEVELLMRKHGLVPRPKKPEENEKLQSEPSPDLEKVDSLASKSLFQALFDYWAMYPEEEAGHGKLSREHNPELVVKVSEQNINEKTKKVLIDHVIVSFLGEEKSAANDSVVSETEQEQNPTPLRFG